MAVSSQTLQQLLTWGQQAAAQYGVPWNYFYQQINAESGWNPNVGNSSAGAVGIAQFMPSTAAGFGIDPTNPQESLQAAAQYDAGLFKQFGNWQQAFAAYNWGPGNVSSSPSYTQWPAETQNYVNGILGTGSQSTSQTNSLPDPTGSLGRLTIGGAQTVINQQVLQAIAQGNTSLAVKLLSQPVAANTQGLQGLSTNNQSSVNNWTYNVIAVVLGLILIIGGVLSLAMSSANDQVTSELKKAGGVTLAP